jgi:formylglycine-generating enzyme required for sulfatase activity
MKQLIRLVAVVLAAFLTCGVLSAQEGPRYALVIGNGDYTDIGRLANPVNDATDIAAALKQMGYQVSILTNANRKQMNQGFNDFHDKLAQDSSSAGFFWYAGHGVQSKGENYLIPVGADIKREVDLEDEAVSVRKLTALLDDARNRINVIVLDACRNNPLPGLGRSATRGLNVVSAAPSESLIMYSTGAGEVAADGAGRNSPFAQAFLKYLSQPGDITATIKSITAETKRLTNGKQVPFLYTSLTLDFNLNPKADAARTEPAKTTPNSSEPDFGSIVVTPGSATLSFATAGTLSLKGKTLDVPAGGTLPVNNLAPGDYPATVTYADGKTESQTIHVEAGNTVNVAFSYKPAPLKPATPEGFAWVEGGSFSMGSPPSETGRGSDEVQHQVSVSGFSMAKYETTVSEFRAFAQDTGYKTTAEIRGKAYVYENNSWTEKAGASWRDPGFGQGGNEPVVCVSWYDAVAYCNWKSAQEGKRPAYSYAGKGIDTRNWPSGWNTETHNNIQCDWTADGYRLPTEAEWEYAARASGSGPQTVAWAGSSSVDEVGWYADNSGSRTHPVGQKKANGIGLYDMSGNVLEWCWDLYSDYSSGAQTSPTRGLRAKSVDPSTARVARGGSWNLDASDLRVARRDNVPPSYAISSYGFRVCVPSVR